MVCVRTDFQVRGLSAGRLAKALTFTLACTKRCRVHCPLRASTLFLNNRGTNMSRTIKLRQKRKIKARIKHATGNGGKTDTIATGVVGGRTQKLHRKLQIYPKT